MNEKWTTDVTELKYSDSKKAYLSAILDLYGGGSIISYLLGHSRTDENIEYSSGDLSNDIIDTDYSIEMLDRKKEISWLIMENLQMLN